MNQPWVRSELGVTTSFGNFSGIARDVNTAFKFNRETEFTPILGLIEAELNTSASTADAQPTKKFGASSIQDNHHAALLATLAEHLSVAPEEIHDFEL